MSAAGSGSDSYAFILKLRRIRCLYLDNDSPRLCLTRGLVERIPAIVGLSCLLSDPKNMSQVSVMFRLLSDIMVKYKFISLIGHKNPLNFSRQMTVERYS